MPLFYTKHPANIDGDHDCLYRSARSSYGRGRQLVPYCIRSRDITYQDQPSICYGTLFTYDELAQNNININQLVGWNAPMDLVDDYAEWLESQRNRQSTYCNCSDSEFSFGTRCQYQFVFKSRSLDSIVEQNFALKAKMKRDIRKLTVANVTCYTSLQCRTVIPDICLDWRQICDGVLDCENGSDEERCLEMELNECDPVTEYRCLSGHCVPYSFSFDLTLDCLDFYDEKETLEENMICSISPSVDCEEHACGLSRLSCGDGECFPSKHGINSKLCTSERVHLFIKKIFAFEIGEKLTVTRRCLSNTLSHLGLDLLFENVELDDTDDGTFAYYDYDLENPHPCRGTFLFPPNPIVLPSIRLGHVVDTYTWDERPIICFNNNDFDHSLEISSFDIEGYACIYLIEYSRSFLPTELNNLRDVTLLIQSLRVIFSSRPNNITAPSLFQCPNGMQISNHRLANGYYDCYMDDADEYYTKDSCLETTKDHYRCITDKYVKCIPRRSLHDGHEDCVDADDEQFGISCTEQNDCFHFRQFNLSAPLPIIYEELCNGREVLEFTWLEQHGLDETDETNCFDWPCNARSIRCDGKWDRANGCDEVGCTNPSTISYIRNKSHCASDEHYCAKFNRTTMGCLPLSRTADGIVDCLFNTDERETSYENDKYYIVRCMNTTSLYVKEQDICNRHQRCPLADDELLCPWHINSSCQGTDFTCKNGTCIGRWRRCDQHIDCPEGEDEWICDMFKPRMPSQTTTLRLPLVLPTAVPPSNMNISEIYAAFHCHRGILLKGKDGHDMCTCPPSYYGKQCEQQSNRLSVSFRVETTSLSSSYAIFQFVFSLLDNRDMHVLTHERLIISMATESIYKHLIYLMYPTSLSLSANKSVRIDAYKITTNLGIIETSLLSWSYNVQFPFLPVNRLAVRLLMEGKSTNNTICSHLACQHGICKSFVNSDHHFCQCNPEWTGLSCNQSLAHLCAKLQCGSHSKCVSLAGDDYVVCLCSLGWTGTTCRVPIDNCERVQCQNGGHCMSLDERTGGYECHCPAHYFGALCQFSEARLTVHVSSMIVYKPLMIIHFLQVPSGMPGRLLHRSIQFHRNVHPDTNIVTLEKNQHVLSSFIVAQLFEHALESHYGSYYLLTYSSVINQTHLTTSISDRNRCPHVREFMNSTMMKEQWLKRVKFYHKFSRNLTCYYDEIYLCFIDDSDNSRLNCLIINHEATVCTERNYCKNEGRCFQRQLSGQLDYQCICPECFYGEFCQLSMTQYSLTIDSMLGPIIITNMSLNEQPLFIKLVLALVTILFIVGTVSNMCSLITFAHVDARSVGCGIYLLLLAIFSQIGLVLFFSRFVYFLVNQMTIINNHHLLKLSCLLADFSLNLFIVICDWLTACVALERTVNCLMGVQFNKRLSAHSAKFVILFLIVILTLASIHQVFSKTLVPDPRSSMRLWCVIKYKYTWLQTYSTIINLFNSSGPSIINMTSTIILLLSLSKKKERSGTAKKRTYIEILRIQIRAHKPLLISPLGVIILKLPVLIVLLIIKCIKYPWQMYLTLTCYLIAFVPLATTFLIFVVPAHTYRNYFQANRRRLFTGTRH